MQRADGQTYEQHRGDTQARARDLDPSERIADRDDDEQQQQWVVDQELNQEASHWVDPVRIRPGRQGSCQEVEGKCPAYRRFPART